ncbi:MAG: bifunctional oligoribonuclease/PAP phosphatase NrnA [Thermotaleaceae bacterium]
MKGINSSLSQIADVLEKGKRVLILPHIHPDGDTIGSSIALSLALKKNKKEVFILAEDEIPQNLDFLPLENIHWKIPSGFQPDIVIAVDASDVKRLGKRADFIHAEIATVNLDHHVTNDYFAQYNYVDFQAAATGEVIYALLPFLKVSLDDKIATSIYTAISTDTGSFKYDNTTAKTHQIVSELLRYSIDLSSITTALYQNKPFSQIKLLGEALNTLELYYSGKLAVIGITREMLENAKADISVVDGLIEFARDIKGVEVAVLLKNLSENEIKVGLRSKYDIDVSKIALLFGGGGHKKASGCTIFSTIENAKKQIIDVLKDNLEFR